jgi:hypothetical protein
MKRQIKIDWTQETENVRESCLALLRAHNLWEALEGKDLERYNELIEIMLEPEAEKPKHILEEEVQEDVKDNTTLPIPGA